MRTTIIAIAYIASAAFAYSSDKSCYKGDKDLRPQKECMKYAGYAVFYRKVTGSCDNVHYSEKVTLRANCCATCKLAERAKKTFPEIKNSWWAMKK
jgi:hypothetical protein